MNGTEVRSLVSLCRNVIVTNLERYPGESFAILDEMEWDTLIKLKHAQTKPKLGKGGLDGTGRMNPVVNDKFIAEVEEKVPHFATSEVVDLFCWRDIVNHKFRVGGLSRPKCLLYPYPVLEARIKSAGGVLIDLRKRKSFEDDAIRVGSRAIKCLCESPMDVGLLESSGIGKIVQKFINTCTKNESKNFNREAIKNLEMKLEEWKLMARNAGVVMKDKNLGANPEVLQINTEQRDDLTIARECKSWRELFYTLTSHDRKRRESQGARMRERREKLNSERPKIVKVRHKRDVNVKEVLLASSSVSRPSAKMQKLRDDARILSTRRSPSGPAIMTGRSTGVKRGFGAAVAFATVSQKRQKQGQTILNLGANKIMKLPNGKPAARDWNRKKN